MGTELHLPTVVTRLITLLSLAASAPLPYLPLPHCAAYSQMKSLHLNPCLGHASGEPQLSRSLSHSDSALVMFPDGIPSPYPLPLSSLPSPGQRGPGYSLLFNPSSPRSVFTPF